MEFTHSFLLWRMNSVRQLPEKDFYHDRHIRWEWVPREHCLAFDCSKSQQTCSDRLISDNLYIKWWSINNNQQCQCHLLLTVQLKPQTKWSQVHHFQREISCVWQRWIHCARYYTIPQLWRSLLNWLVVYSWLWLWTCVLNRYTSYTTLQCQCQCQCQM